MNRQRVLLLENDAALESVLCELFAGEALDVTACDSLTELEDGVMRYPRAVVVSDSWSSGDNHTLSSDHRAEIIALAGTTEVVLITARTWARAIRQGELGSAVIVEKPFDLGHLMVVVRAALARAAVDPSADSGKPGVPTLAARMEDGATQGSKDTRASPAGLLATRVSDVAATMGAKATDLVDAPAA